MHNSCLCSLSFARIFHYWNFLQAVINYCKSWNHFLRLVPRLEKKATAPLTTKSKSVIFDYCCSLSLRSCLCSLSFARIKRHRSQQNQKTWFLIIVVTLSLCSCLCSLAQKKTPYCMRSRLVIFGYYWFFIFLIIIKYPSRWKIASNFSRSF